MAGCGGVAVHILLCLWGSAAKNRRTKKIKLQLVTQELKTISELFNKQTKPEPVSKQ